MSARAAASLILLALTLAAALALSFPGASADLAWIDLRREGDDLHLSLRLAPAARVAEALDAAVPICLRIERRPAAAPARLCLEHLPLDRRYSLSLDGRPLRQFRLRNEAFAALEDFRLPGAGSTALRVRLDPADLPAPLRLPASLQKSWQLDAGWRPIRP